MSAEAKRMLWWVCISWLVVFGVAVAACIAPDAVNAKTSNKLLLVSAFVGVVAGIEVKRGWMGFGLLFVSSASAFFLGSAAGLEYLRLFLHSPHWFHGVVRATIVGGACLAFSIAALSIYLKHSTDPSADAMPLGSASETLEWLNKRDARWDEDRRRQKVQYRLQQILCGAGLCVTIALGAWKMLGISFWISALPAMAIGSALILLSEKLSSAIFRKLLGPQTRKLEELRAEAEPLEARFREILVAKAAEEARLNVDGH